MLNPDYHKNDGESLLSKIIFDCATKAKLAVHVHDFVVNVGKGQAVHVRRFGTYWCAAYLQDNIIRLDFHKIANKIDSRVSPKFWHVLVRPDSIECEMCVNINDPGSFDEIIELFVALRPIR